MLDESIIDFPNKPMKNRHVEEQIKIMKSNREYLKKLDFNSQVLILPDICVSKCDTRRLLLKILHYYWLVPYLIRSESDIFKEVAIIFPKIFFRYKFD